MRPSSFANETLAVADVVPSVSPRWLSVTGQSAVTQRRPITAIQNHEAVSKQTECRVMGEEVKWDLV